MGRRGVGQNRVDGAGGLDVGQGLGRRFGVHVPQGIKHLCTVICFGTARLGSVSFLRDSGALLGGTRCLGLDHRFGCRQQLQSPPNVTKPTYLN